MNNFNMIKMTLTRTFGKVMRRSCQVKYEFCLIDISDSFSALNFEYLSVIWIVLYFLNKLLDRFWEFV